MHVVVFMLPKPSQHQRQLTKRKKKGTIKANSHSHLRTDAKSYAFLSPYLIIISLIVFCSHKMDAVFGTTANMLYESSSHAEAIACMRKSHSEKQAQAQLLHEEELRATSAQFSEAQSQKRALFIEAALHKQTLAENESKRDLWQQRNEATQTIMIVCTVAFVCAYSLIVDGLNQWQDVVSEHPRISLAYAILAGASLFLLLVAFSLCLLLYHRMGMYRALGTYPFCSSGRCEGIHVTFSGFYYHHCLPLERALVGFFYAGICSTLGGLITYQLPKHLYVFGHDELAGIFVVVVSIGIVWPVVGMFLWPFTTWVARENPSMHM